ncbi:MAG: alpha/beta hydrolase fold domain-containing protein, partial [Lachnospiraceae bacterium]|nr:alpha/beta hydrolase fold domain-containing protein [Lachnospiraceae bacterium]
MSNPLIKTLKAANFMAGKASTEAEIKRHRKLADWAGGLATPKGDVERKRFRLGKIRCEEFRPYFAHNPEYVILYCHGGGYVSGGLGYAGNLSTKLATATGFTAYSFAYRLAPEHPYPAAAEDADVVWNYLTENVVPADHVILAGDSAGGNMALCLTQRLIAQGKPVPRLLLLFSPWTDMTGTAESYEANRDTDPILSKEFVMKSARAYMGNGDPADAAFSPLFGSFENFPPVYI